MLPRRGGGRKGDGDVHAGRGMSVPRHSLGARLGRQGLQGGRAHHGAAGTVRGEGVRGRRTVVAGVHIVRFPLALRGEETAWSYASVTRQQRSANKTAVEFTGVYFSIFWQRESKPIKPELRERAATASADVTINQLKMFFFPRLLTAREASAR